MKSDMLKRVSGYSVVEYGASVPCDPDTALELLKACEAKAKVLYEDKCEALQRLFR